MLTKQDFELPAGDSLTLRLHIEKPDGDPFPLDGCSITWIARKHWDSTASNLITKSTSAGVSIFSASAGIADVTLVGSDSAGLEPDRYFHGAVVQAGSDVYSVLIGTMRIFPRVV